MMRILEQIQTAVKNEEYCQFCYKKGEYTNEGITM
ncbi:MAG: hypothetical protein GKB99_00520 [Methanocellales archaeon]|nr:hypothetical protein [Methanocellales archaeon]